MKFRPEYDMEVIGRNLRSLRERNGLTVESVREYLRMGSVQAIYKYEQGKGYPQADTLLALMELYGATIEDVTGRCVAAPVGVGATQFSGEYKEEAQAASSFLMQKPRKRQHACMKWQLRGARTWSTECGM